jgi:dipeptidyl aminopeptidase/acylaminoacyl peptidase
MRSRPASSALAAAVFLFVLTGGVAAQGTVADYQRAETLRERFDGLAINLPSSPTWIGESSRFWYSRTVPGGHDFVMVDAASATRQPAFDHQRLADGLSRSTGESYDAITLPFRNFNLTEDERAIEFVVEGTGWSCSLTDYTCSEQETRPTRGGASSQQGWQQDTSEPRPSPDGRYEALIRNFNVHLRDVENGKVKQLSSDGSEGNAYILNSAAWSPDSRKLAVNRVIPGYERMVHYIESSPEDQLQPRHSSRVYTKPGDVLDVRQPVLFNFDSERKVVIENSLFPNAFSISRFEWREDSRGFTFEYNQRGHQVYRVIEVDATSGAARAVINEEVETFFYYRPSDGQGKKFRYDIDDGREIIWMSERDGWNHLYLYDGRTGRVKNQITRGNWAVRDIDKVDVENRQIWFQASGMNAGEDPYFIHHYRINFDGRGLVALTEPGANHSVSYSPDMRFYVNTFSRVDLPPISQLRRTSDRQVIMELERTDISELEAAGWSAPEVFTAVGRDGETEIWGVIVRPTNFDPSKRYPVIEYIYAGPQYSFVPKAFTSYSQMMAQAELGFIVVQIDGMGTSNRSKAFHDVAWKNLGDAGFPDRILWHRAVAERYPYYDLDRVGIYGHSAGGQSALGALLFHPEFYHVAVAANGCHDNRMDKIWWNELWMSWPVGPHYAASSNVEHAHKLQGELLLVVGELDTNVDPASTYQVADALIKADKDFELLVLTGQGHTPGGSYGERRRFDFFVRHLMDQAPPRRNGNVLTSRAPAETAKALGEE